MHALRMAVAAKMLAGVIAPAPITAPHTRQRENMPWHFRTRDVLKPPDNGAGIQPARSHAPRPAEHGDDGPARILGGRAAHPSPVLLSTRVSSGAEKLFEERDELTVVAQYQGPDRAEANQPLLGWTRPGAGGGTKKQPKPKKKEPKPTEKETNQPKTRVTTRNRKLKPNTQK